MEVKVDDDYLMICDEKKQAIVEFDGRFESDTHHDWVIVIGQNGGSF